jgi:hypothetical protein
MISIWLSPSSSKHKKVLLPLASLCFLTLFVPYVAKAYALQLNEVVPRPVVHIPGDAFVIAAVTSTNDEEQKAHPRSQEFVSKVVTKAHENPMQRMWLTYPASVRGRTFGSSDGFSSGGSGWQ